MKTEYEFIQFFELVKKPKTSVWACQNRKHGTILGAVKWHAPWRRYCFFPDREMVFSRDCLLDICQFIQLLMQERHGEALAVPAPLAEAKS